MILPCPSTASCTKNPTAASIARHQYIVNVHWVLVIVSIPEKWITIIDSMRGEDEKRFPSKIRDFLNSLFHCFSRGHSWTLEKAHLRINQIQINGIVVYFYYSILISFVKRRKLDLTKLGFQQVEITLLLAY